MEEAVTLTPEILENLKKAAIERGGAVVGVEKEQFLELVEMATGNASRVVLHGQLSCQISRDCGPDRIGLVDPDDLIGLVIHNEVRALDGQYVEVTVRPITNPISDGRSQ